MVARLDRLSKRIALLTGFLGEAGTALLAPAAAALAVMPTHPALAQHLPAGADKPAAAYSNGFPQDASFFPLAVWLQSPAKGAAYKRLGINTFVGLWKGPTESQLAELAKQDLYLIADQNDVGLNSPHRHVIKAWMQADEPDNAKRNWLGLHMACIPPGQVAQRTRDMRKRDPTRPIFVNYGRGVADTQWSGRGLCTGDTDYYATASAGIDIVSFDIYPVAGATRGTKGRLEYVAAGVSNLRRWAKDAQSVWAMIETTRIKHEADRPSPQQIRSEVWLALTAGAKGIIYFVHEFSHGFRPDGIFRHPDAVEAVARINDEIRELAPVLNSPSLNESTVVSGDASVGAMLKCYRGTEYIFAVSKSGSPQRARLMSSVMQNGWAQVIGENRSVEVKEGMVEDAFGPYEVHQYRIAGC